MQLRRRCDNGPACLACNHTSTRQCLTSGNTIIGREGKAQGQRSSDWCKHKHPHPHPHPHTHTCTHTQTCTMYVARARTHTHTHTYTHTHTHTTYIANTCQSSEYHGSIQTMPCAFEMMDCTTREHPLSVFTHDHNRLISNALNEDRPANVGSVWTGRGGEDEIRRWFRH